MDGNANINKHAHDVREIPTYSPMIFRRPCKRSAFYIQNSTEKFTFGGENESRSMSRRTGCEGPTSCMHLACQEVISTPLFQSLSTASAAHPRSAKSHGARSPTDMLSVGHFLFHLNSRVVEHALPKLYFWHPGVLNRNGAEMGSRPRLSAPPPSIFFTAFIRAYLSRRRRGGH